MKNLCMIFLIFSCAHAVSKEKTASEKFLECLDEQVDLYGDLCAESASGYEDMTGSEAHLEGVKCAVESMKICIEAGGE